MQTDDDFARLAASRRTGLSGLFGRLLAYAGTALMLILALMFSALLFSLLALAGLLVGGYLWWKMRSLRRQVEAQVEANVAERAPSGRVIEGEVIRESVTRHEIEP